MYLVARLDPGNTARHAADLSIFVARRGGRAVLASAGGPLLPEVLRGGVAHLPMPLDGGNPLTLWRAAFKLARFARRDGTGLLHARGAAAAWTASLVKRFTGLPLVVTLDDGPEETAAWRRWHAGAIARADHVIVQSRHMAARAAADHGIPAQRMTVIPGGVDMARFDPAAIRGDRIARMAQRWLLPDGVPVILMPKRIAPDKGHEILIEALARLGDRPFACILAGDDRDNESYRLRLEEMAVMRGLGGRLRLVGPIDDMPAAYMLSDAVVCPGLMPEAFDLAAAEAQAMGRPVVGADHGALAELILPERTGWLVPPGDPDLLAASLARALDLDPAGRASLAATARERVAAHFSLSRMCAQSVALYDMLLGSQNRAATAADPGVAAPREP